MIKQPAIICVRNIVKDEWLMGEIPTTIIMRSCDYEKESIAYFGFVFFS